MRTAIIVAVLIFLALFALTTIPYDTSSREEALNQGFTSEEVETGIRRAVQGDLIFWGATAVTFGFFGYLVLSGRARRVTERMEGWFSRRPVGDKTDEETRSDRTPSADPPDTDEPATTRPGFTTWLLTLLGVWAFCFVAERLLLFPFAVLSLENSRAWGMTDITILQWLQYYGQNVGFKALLELVVVAGLYVLIRSAPRWWWAWAGSLGGAFGFVMVCIWPIVVVPMVYEVRPLENAELNARIMRLAEKAEVKIDRVYVMDASSRSRHTNAYFMGIGSTRRILVYDTLLKSHSDDQLESVLAHEIGHWKHNHALVGLCLATCGGFLGCFLLRWALIWAIGRRPFNLRSPSDPAGLPYVLLLFMISSWAVMPIENAIARHFERQADWVALELAGNDEAFIGMERKMAKDNQSNVVPNPFAVWLFSTHPPVLQRMDMARRWRERDHPSPAPKLRILRK